MSEQGSELEADRARASLPRTRCRIARAVSATSRQPLLPPPGWTAADTVRLRALLDAHPR
jgi:hypothetical protein